ncbi:hypothetical protein ILUMI_17361, partial [Ignelater luminosus]
METLVHIRQNFQSAAPPPYSEQLLDDSDFADDDDYLENASRNRTRTDLPFLIMHGLCLLVL